MKGEVDRVCPRWEDLEERQPSAQQKHCPLLHETLSSQVLRIAQQRNLDNANGQGIGAKNWSNSI
jgi:hypothetical protein